jgi:hypothetical protein
MWDVIMNTVGALAVSSLGWGYVVRGEHSFLEDWIQTFIERSMRLFRWGSTQESGTPTQGIFCAAAGRNGPQKLDSALSEIFVGFQAANLRFT